MDEAKATEPQPKWWSRPRRRAPDAPGVSGEQPAAAPPSPAVPEQPPGETEAQPPAGQSAPAEKAGADAVSGSGTAETAQSPPAPPAEPLHGVDPYSTPPYGGPGPWAPAPLVQRPTTTPAHGVPLPLGFTPAHGTNVTAHTAAPMPAAAPPAPAPPPAPAAAPPPVPAAAPLPVPTVPAEQGPRPQPLSSPWLRYDPWAAPVSPDAAYGPPPGARKGKRGRLFAGAVVLAVTSGLVGGLVGTYLERDGVSGQIELPQAPPDKDARRAPGSVAGIAEQALPGVVTLHVGGRDGGATGTGFVLDKRGHILTNNHVIDSAGGDGPIEVTFHNGQSVKGKVIGSDGGYDLAVVKVSGVSGLSALPLGNSDSTKVGDPVVAIGAPFDLEGTVTYGIVSATHRPIASGGGPESSDTSFVDALQTDAPVNPGNSGGPLVDSAGRVIGINSAIQAADSGPELPGGGEGGSIGLGFAIPVNQGKRVAEELINNGRATHPVIGVRLDPEYGGDGARIGGSGSGDKPVLPGGPGDKAGIKKGDVITAVDGARVHSAEELIVKVRSHRPGDVLELTLRRDDDERSVRLKLGSADDGE
jgi:putative serine protease PepD